MPLSNHPNVLSGGNAGLTNSGGTVIGGTIAATQVAYGSAANTIKGEAAFVYDETADTLSVGVVAIAGQTGTGVIRLPAATTSAGGITFGDVNLYRTGAGLMNYFSSGNMIFGIDGASSNTSGFVLYRSGAEGSRIVHSASSTLAISSVGAITLATNGSPGGTTAITLDSSQNATGVGYLQGSQVRVQAKTQAASPYSVSATTDNRNVFTNEGASSLVTFNLPTASSNLDYTFVVQDADGIRVVANTGDTIRIAGSVSASAGRIDSTTIGSSIRLVAINATEFIAVAVSGTWSVT